MSPEDARERFAAARVARLATADRGGRPHIVPIVFALDGDRIYSAVDQKPKRTTALRRLANIVANPSVSLLVDHYEDDWERLWWVRADGRASLLDPQSDETRLAVALLARRYPQQQVTGAVVRVVVERWVGWSAA